MTIRVEFFGVARQRTNVAVAELPIAGPVRLEEVIRYLAVKYPAFASECLKDFCLQPSYVANIDGQRFVRDPNTKLEENACLLIMSADAGG